MEKIQKENLEEVKAQLLANQERLAATEGKGPSWEEKVGIKAYRYRAVRVRF